MQDNAEVFRKQIGDDSITQEHLFLGLARGTDAVGKLMQTLGLYHPQLVYSLESFRLLGHIKNTKDKETGHTPENNEDISDSIKNVEDMIKENDSQNTSALQRYARNLNEASIQGQIDPVIGRDEEVRRVLQIISRRTKNNPMLIGEPGVGKTAIVEGLAQRIVQGDVPEGLRSKRIVSLDMGLLVAGAKYKGEFEERLKAVVREVTDSGGEIVLFIDEIHTLIGAGASGEGAMDAANLLKPALARGELHAIGATTLKEYQQYIEKDKAL